MAFIEGSSITRVGLDRVGVSGIIWEDWSVIDWGEMSEMGEMSAIGGDGW